MGPRAGAGPSQAGGKPGVKLQWQPRPVALEACGVWAQGPSARNLVTKLLNRDLAQLRACAHDDQLIVLGPNQRLPWVDQAIYLGLDPQQGQLYLPTLWRPSLPLDWIRPHLVRFAPPPWLMLPQLPQPLALGQCSAVDGADLLRFAAQS